MGNALQKIEKIVSSYLVRRVVCFDMKDKIFWGNGGNAMLRFFPMGQPQCD